jgi:WD40 repeat protein
MASVSEVLPLEVWVRYGPELSQRYLGWEETQLLTIAEEIWHGPLVPVLMGHEAWVSSVAVTPDGQYVVSGSKDRTVRLWDLATGQEVRRFTGHESTVRSVAVTPDGKYVV